MPDFTVDGAAFAHPKLLAAGNGAVGLWLRCGAWSAQHLTDGTVPGQVAAMHGTAPQIRKLLAVGLWHDRGHACPRCAQPAADGYVIHDWADYQEPSTAVRARREADAARKRRQRDRDRERVLSADDSQDYPQAEKPAIHRAVSGVIPGQRQVSRRDTRDTHTTPPLSENPPTPATTHQQEREQPRPAARAPRTARPRRTSAPAADAVLLPEDWQPSAHDVQAAQAARTDTGRSVLTGAQLADLTRKFVRRQVGDARLLPLAAWGARWQEWAERERPADNPDQQGSFLFGLAGGGLAGGAVPRDLLWPHELTPDHDPVTFTTVLPMQGCDNCTRGYRGEPGLCRDCRAQHAAATG